MTKTTGTAVVALTPTAPRKLSIKRIGQLVGAAALSAGLVGTFALPAYATPNVEGAPDGFASQTLVTDIAAEDASLALGTPGAEEVPVAAPEPAVNTVDTTQARSVPTSEALASAQGQGIVAAALAQIGMYQDCTALVENALRVGLGIGVGDLGTQPGEWAQFGSYVTDGSYAPGDILIWQGRHVAVYIGNGQAVHGGFGGNQTVVAGAFIDGAPSHVVRVG